MACRFSLLGSRLAEDRIVLDNVSWQFRLSLFVLGHFFLLSVDLGLSIKWAMVVKFFGLTLLFSIHFLLDFSRMLCGCVLSPTSSKY